VISDQGDAAFFASCGSCSLRIANDYSSKRMY